MLLDVFGCFWVIDPDFGHPVGGPRLFDHFAKLPEGATYKTLVGFMEIYNEQIRDLLAT